VTGTDEAFSTTMRIRVAIAAPGAEAERIPEFSKPEITIGRMPSNDVVLPEAGVSSTHARVLVTGNTLTILDLDSTNGTFVNEEPLRGPRVIHEGDEVQIGEFLLHFSLQGGTIPEVSSQDAGHAASASRSATGMPAGWPDEPPMLDELGVSATVDGGTKGSAAASPVSERRPAVFPPFAPPAKPASAPAPKPAGEGARAPASSSSFEFGDASADGLMDRIFGAVWNRVSPEVLTASAGARAMAERLLDEAFRAAPRSAALARPDELRTRMLDEMTGDTAARSLLQGDPDELLVHGAARMRVNRAGHVTEGPSPFTCAAAVACFVTRACRVAFDATQPVARGNYGGYAIEAVHATELGAPVVSLRRVLPQGASTLEGLVQHGILSHSIATLLATCVVARHSFLLCAGPGANIRPLAAALMACAPLGELHVVVGHRGVDPSAYRSGTVVLARAAGHDELLDSALALGPDRITIEDVHWTEARAVVGIVARPLGLLLGVRARAANLGLGQVESMLGPIVPRASLGALLAQSFDVVVASQLFADGVSRVTQVAEPIVDEHGNASTRDIFALVPGTRTWQFAGGEPRCYEELTRRGFRVDPAIFT
jgi:pilus assembly protein CpaF